MLAMLWSCCVTLGADVEWTRFYDLQGVFLADPFAKSLKDLSVADREYAIKRLDDALHSESIELQRRSALILGALGDSRGVPVMVAAMSSATGRDRNNLVVALRILKDPRAIPILRTALADKAPYVRMIAVAALGELKASEAYDDIVASLKDMESEQEHIPSLVAPMACYALGALGDLRAVPSLVECLGDPKLAGSAMAALEALTHQKYGKDQRKWMEWWKLRRL